MSPDRFIQKTLNELNAFTKSCLDKKFYKNSEQLIYQIGHDLSSSNVEINTQIKEYTNLRTCLLDSKKFTCLNCTNFKSHVCF